MLFFILLLIIIIIIILILILILFRVVIYEHQTKLPRTELSDMMIVSDKAWLSALLADSLTAPATFKGLLSTPIFLG